MTDRKMESWMLRDLARVLVASDDRKHPLTECETMLYRISHILEKEAARREAEEPCPVCGYDCAGANPPVSYCPKKDEPPPPAPFVTDHKWLDPECHASGCQTLILKAEIEKLRDQRDKYMWQVRDTCARAEKAEAFLAELSADYKALLEYCGAESIMEIRDGYMKYKELNK